MKFVWPMLALLPVALMSEYAPIAGSTAVFLASALSLVLPVGLSVGSSYYFVS